MFGNSNWHHSERMLHYFILYTELSSVLQHIRIKVIPDTAIEEITISLLLANRPKYDRIIIKKTLLCVWVYANTDII